jgi:exopolyphosphatase/guanosine-5'-triphosphate,3'-diphosphate pyrophosphatase
VDKIAIIELSTIGTSLTVAKISENGYFDIVDKLDYALNLKEDIAEDGLIKPNKVVETIKSLQNFKVLCDSYSVKNFNIYATNSMNDAYNVKSFLDEVENATGFKFRILTRDEEISLTHIGIISTSKINKGLIINIKHNSIEIVKYNRKNIFRTEILDFGSLTVADEALKSGEDVGKRFQAMVNFVNDKIKNIPPFQDEGEEPINAVGAGSGFIDLSRLSRARNKYSFDLDNNYSINQNGMNNIFTLVKGLDFDNKKRIKGISEERSDVVVSSVVIAYCLFNKFNINEYSISTADYTTGYLFNTCSKFNKMNLDPLTWSLNCIEEFDNPEYKRGEQVRTLTLQIFDELKSLHRAGKIYACALKIASSLSFAGRKIKFDENEKNSLNVVLNSNIYGVGHREIILAAFICQAQNIDDFDVSSWVKYSDILQSEDLDYVKKLGILIKLAKAIDRARNQELNSVECDVLGDSVIVKIVSSKPLTLEIPESMKCVKDFKKIYNKNLQVL